MADWIWATPASLLHTHTHTHNKPRVVTMWLDRKRIVNKPKMTSVSRVVDHNKYVPRHRWYVDITSTYLHRPNRPTEQHEYHRGIVRWCKCRSRSTRSGDYPHKKSRFTRKIPICMIQRLAVWNRIDVWTCTRILTTYASHIHPTYVCSHTNHSSDRVFPVGSILAHIGTCHFISLI